MPGVSQNLSDHAITVAFAYFARVGRPRTGYDVAVTLLDAVLEADYGLPPR
jgi:NADH/NAD ratio-sensing transcriptional regulator Rex